MRGTAEHAHYRTLLHITARYRTTLRATEHCRALLHRYRAFVAVHSISDGISAAHTSRARGTPLQQQVGTPHDSRYETNPS